MSIQLRIILQYATERCISSSKKKKTEKKGKSLVITSWTYGRLIDKAAAPRV